MKERVVAKKIKVEKFQAVDKALVKGKIKHTRTGACTAIGRCYHGRKVGRRH